ncbi:MAG: hypothetical protein A4E19_03865 [Nitrospira sp. SG-bin1]|nr:MAG: hypothetical protein A4E19_03865 [Nitrospira sp. SG-bin1]
MAKKGYPGLVLVPPSDRTILRRRILRWSLCLIALIWGASTLSVWRPTSHDSVSCPPAVGQETSVDSPEKCGQLEPIPEPPSNPNEFTLTQVSQAEGLTESKDPLPSPPDPNRPAAEHNHDQASQPQPSEPAHHPVNHDVAPHTNDKSAARLPAAIPSQNPTIDVRLPDAPATPQSHGPDPKPTSSELTIRPVDHNVASLGNDGSASSATSKPAQDPDIDVRLAEQGDAFAQYRLGRFYAQQNGRQAPESVKWYKKAATGLRHLAETGNGQAMYVLGVMYAYGRGVTRDTEQARRWLTQAVENKITAAQPVLTSLETNRGTDPRSPTSNRSKNVSQHH